MLEGSPAGSFLVKNDSTGLIRLVSAGNDDSSSDLKEYDQVVLCLGWRFDATPFRKGGIELGMGGVVGWKRRLALARAVRNQGAAFEVVDAAGTD